MRLCAFFVQMMLGSLRESEVELLSENMRFAITETCLALTIFREELRQEHIYIYIRCSLSYLLQHC
jgi:hypothetical protein